MKVLLIAAGRRVSLARRFIDKGFEVYSYEIENQCPISTVATIINGKSWNDPEIRNHLFDTIKEIKPDLVLGLADQALPILSSISYRGVITASGQTNSLCLNKKKFEQYFELETFYPRAEAGYPIILKPIFGANSKGLVRGVSFNDYIGKKVEYDRTYIGQRQIEGDLEISVDAYFNRFSKMVDAVPRKRIEIQGGEVCRSITLPRKKCYETIELTRKIGEKIGLVGPVCAQYVINSNNKAFIMEINARLGGGVILSMEAGFDQIELMMKEYIERKDIEVKETEWKENFGMTRYFTEYFYKGE